MQVTGEPDADPGNPKKRPKTAHETVKEQNTEDESSELTEPEETEAVMTHSKDDDKSGKTDSPEEQQVCIRFSALSGFMSLY